jgi:hypothetical protein
MIERIAKGPAIMQSLFRRTLAAARGLDQAHWAFGDALVAETGPEDALDEDDRLHAVQAALADGTGNGFPLSFKAAQDLQDWQWALGDALLAECGPPDAENYALMESRLAAACVELRAHGHSLELNVLRCWRDTSHYFPVDAGMMQHELCVAAGSPAMLTEFMKLWEVLHPHEPFTEPACYEERMTVQGELLREHAQALGFTVESTRRNQLLCGHANGAVVKLGPAVMRDNHGWRTALTRLHRAAEKAAHVAR